VDDTGIKVCLGEILTLKGGTTREDGKRTQDSCQTAETKPIWLASNIFHRPIKFLTYVQPHDILLGAIVGRNLPGSDKFFVGFRRTST
jgi:hypothetical protein